MDSEFEKEFGGFIDRREYDNAENALFEMVRLAFLAGWKAAGGEMPRPHPVFTLIRSDEKQ